jgi:hypothetical protein
VSRSRASRAAVILAAVAAAGLCSGYPPGHGCFHWVSEAQAQAKRCAAEPAAPGTGAPASEPNLAPITLSPQRMQSIGVKTGVVEFRPVRDEIRTVGDIEADETQYSDLQGVSRRFPLSAIAVCFEHVGQVADRQQRLLNPERPVFE